jgi:hypothetical protein
MKTIDFAMDGPELSPEELRMAVGGCCKKKRHKPCPSNNAYSKSYGSLEAIMAAIGGAMPISNQSGSDVVDLTPEGGGGVETERALLVDPSPID